MRRNALPLILIAFLLAAAALAQEVQYAVGFESVAGDAVDSDGFASGDVVVLRVDLHNGSDAPLLAGAFWVAFPPVEGATLFGNSGDGFSFPDRMLDVAGEEVMVDHGAGAGATQLTSFQRRWRRARPRRCFCRSRCFRHATRSAT